MGILRKKMNGATDKETVTDIRELVASGLSLTSGSAIAAKVEENRSSLDSNDAMSSCNAESTSSSASTSDAPSLDHSVSNSNNSLSAGPVTDL